MAQVSEAMMSNLQNVDMLALCSSHDDRRGSGPEVPATPHFRHRDTSKAALPDPEAARSRFRPGMRAGGTCTQPRRLQQRPRPVSPGRRLRRRYTSVAPGCAAATDANAATEAAPRGPSRTWTTWRLLETRRLGDKATKKKGVGATRIFKKWQNSIYRHGNSGAAGLAAGLSREECGTVGRRPRRASGGEARWRRGAYIKSLVYGGLDGIITTFAIVCAAVGTSRKAGHGLREPRGGRDEHGIGRHPK